MGAKEFAAIIRPLNCLIAAFGTFVGYSVAASVLDFPSEQLAFAMAVAFLVCAGGMAINDFFDRGIDRKLHPSKPIPSGAISPNAALAYALILFIAGNALALYRLPIEAIAIAAAFSLLLIAYSAFLSKAKYIGNFVVAAGTAFTLIFGASLTGQYDVVAFFALAALCANLARELIKDLEDREADIGRKISLPMVIGKKPVLGAVFLYYLLAAFFVYFPAFLLEFSKIAFVGIVSIANLLFMLSSRKAWKGQYKKAQGIAKAAMLLALLAFLAGVL